LIGLKNLELGWGRVGGGIEKKHLSSTMYIGFEFYFEVKFN
jgi:hypothetical protein